jgi:hypothetical protein
MNNIIKCDCGEEYSLPIYPHAESMYDVCFLPESVVVVRMRCSKCGMYLTTSFGLSKIETVTEK